MRAAATVGRPGGTAVRDATTRYLMYGLLPAWIVPAGMNRLLIDHQVK